jgi:hypothetical protein
LSLNPQAPLLICSRLGSGLESNSTCDSSLEHPMAVAAEEARELLAAGHGYRCEIGDCINIEVGQVEE